MNTTSLHWFRCLFSTNHCWLITPIWAAFDSITFPSHWHALSLASGVIGCIFSVARSIQALEWVPWARWNKTIYFEVYKKCWIKYRGKEIIWKTYSINLTHLGMFPHLCVRQLVFDQNWSSCRSNNSGTGSFHYQFGRWSKLHPLTCTVSDNFQQM